MNNVQDPQTEGVRNALSAAEDFERKHYDTNADGSAQELDAGDFQQAVGAGVDYISGAAQNVKDAVVGEEPAVNEETADAADAAHHVPVPPAAEDAEGIGGKTWTESIKDMGAAVANKVAPEAHAMESSAGDKWGQAKKDAREGADKLGDAAGEALDALGQKTRRAGEHVDDQAQRAGDAAARGADRTGDQAKGAWQELKDVTGGAKDRVVDDAQDAKNRAEARIDANTAGKYNSPAHQGATGTNEGGIFQGISNAVKSVTDRFTAPVSGDEATDKSVIDKATGKAEDSADAARGKARDVADSAQAKADDAKERAKSNFSRDTRDKAYQSKEEAKQAAEDAKRGIKSAANDAKESAEAAARDAKNAVKEKAEEVEDYLTADLSPHNAEEAALQGGQIPSNTADVLAHGGGAGGISDAPSDIQATEQAQGMNIMADKLNAAVDLGYGEENLGADDAEDLRQATEGSGRHAAYK